MNSTILPIESIFFASFSGFPLTEITFIHFFPGYRLSRRIASFSTLRVFKEVQFTGSNPIQP
ncbi:hypothetical protein SAMN03080617_02491 [Algoriphagus alkaliphilus]|uniref:Uncharacterized protein n=1 Tax=Algoriphagus alkaliphilus TaxID=279824 RepID=A0A1G5YE85_9BACT|nr:hypothetical protein SAMN03080617_02491 [Algoriphagus alkaliphilus]